MGAERKEDYKLIANQDELSTEIDASVYERFRLYYRHKMKPLLDELRLNRAKSYESAIRDFLNIN